MSAFSCAIGFALKKNGGTKNGLSCFEKLPYTQENLKKHIESGFEWWMNWDNYGPYISKTWIDDNPTTWTWNIDHIIPISLLPHDSMDHPNFIKCWSLNNLRPFSSKANLHKSNRVLAPTF